MLNSRSPVGAESVETEAILLAIYFLDEAGSQYRPLGGVDLALEDGVLNPLPEILAQSRNAPETAAPGRVAGGHVVCDEHEHRCTYFQRNGG